MADIYSELLYSRSNFNVNDTIELDSSYVWIVRDVEGYFYENVNAGGLLLEESANGCIWYSTTFTSIPSGGSHFEWHGRQVFVPRPSAPTITVAPFVPSTVLDLRICGYRLTPP